MPPVPPIPPQMELERARREPIGAIVLILLGMLFLFNTLGFFNFGWVSHGWPLIIVGIAVWLLMRNGGRLLWRASGTAASGRVRRRNRRMPPQTGEHFAGAADRRWAMNQYLFLRRMRGPIMLLTFGITAILDEYAGISYAHSWPLYIIVWGLLKLAENAILAQNPPQAAARISGIPRVSGTGSHGLHLVHGGGARRSDDDIDDDCATTGHSNAGRGGEVAYGNDTSILDIAGSAVAGQAGGAGAAGSVEGADARAKGLLQDVLAGLAQAIVRGAADPAEFRHHRAADGNRQVGRGGVLGLVRALVAAAADRDGRAAAGGAFSGLEPAVGRATGRWAGLSGW